MIGGFEQMQKSVKESAELSMKTLGEIGEAWQAIASEAADYSKRSFEDSSAAMEKMMAARDPGTLFELQSGYSRAAYEAYVGEVGKLGTMVSDLAKGMARPYEAMFSAFR